MNCDGALSRISQETRDVGDDEASTEKLSREIAQRLEMFLVR